MSPMTDAQLAEIAARLRAATPGPWTKDHRGGGVVRGSTLIEFVRGSSYTQVALAVGLHEKEAGGQEENATFIANAPADIAALIAEVARLRKLHPIDTYHEDIGNVLWWRVPIQEPPYCGSPLEEDFPGDYYTHWSKLPEVTE